MTAALALVTDDTELPEWLTTADIMDKAGITARQCDFWARAGYLEPGRGSGSLRVWPKSELEVAQRMGRLTRAGIPASLAAFMARESWPRAEIAPGIFIEVAS